MKKILQTVLIIVMSVVAVSATAGAKPAYAAKDEDRCSYFLGMPAWDCNVSIKGIDSESKIKDSIWTIVANIATALITLATYLTLGFVITGGYKYMFAKGDPNKVAEGKKTLFASFIGLAIAILARAIVSTILYAMLKGGVGGTVEGAGSEAATEVFNNMVDWVIGIAGLVATIFLVYGGVTYMTSAGDAGKVVRAKNTIIYALIGMLIVGLATAITGFVRKNIEDAENSSFVVEKLIAKGEK